MLLTGADTLVSFSSLFFVVSSLSPPPQFFDLIHLYSNNKPRSDIRNLNNEWVHIHATAGDFIIFPAGIEHRFAVDEKLYIQAMRLFPGSGDPDWSSVARSNIHGNNTARNEYVDNYLCGVDPDLDHVHTPDNDSSANDSHGILVGVMSMAAALTMLAW